MTQDWNTKLSSLGLNVNAPPTKLGIPALSHFVRHHCLQGSLGHVQGGERETAISSEWSVRLSQSSATARRACLFNRTRSWNFITQDAINNAIDSMPARLKAVIGNRGQKTPFRFQAHDVIVGPVRGGTRAFRITLGSAGFSQEDLAGGVRGSSTLGLVGSTTALDPSWHCSRLTLRRIHRQCVRLG